MNFVINTWGSFSLSIAWFDSRVLKQRVEKIVMPPNVGENSKFQWDGVNRG